MNIIETQEQARNTRHVEGVRFKCAACGEVKPVQTNGGTGYGYGENDEIVCYACCGERDKARMIETGKATLYFVPVVGAGWNACNVTNWPGTLAFRGGYSVGRHNIARKRYDVTFNGPDGYVWHGVTYGDNTQICHCKRTKKRA